MAMPNQTAETVADCMVDSVICRHGVPEHIISDRGVQFLSLLFKRLNKRLGVKTLKTSSFHPQSNSPAEKLNRFIANSLSILCDKNQLDWDKYLGFISLAYRVSVVEGVKNSPFSLVYGRECTLPTDILYGDKNKISIDQNQYKTQLTHRLRESFDVARKTQSIFNSRKKEYYDRSHSDIKFKIGSFIILRTPTAKVGLSKKLIPQFNGPYEVLQKCSDLNYKVKCLKNNKIQRVHVQRMIKYSPLSTYENKVTKSDDF